MSISKKLKSRARSAQYGREADAYYSHNDVLCLCGHNRGYHDVEVRPVGRCEHKDCGCQLFAYPFVQGQPTSYGTFHPDNIYQGPENAVLKVSGLPVNIRLEELQKEIRLGDTRYVLALEFAAFVVKALNTAALAEHKQKHWTEPVGKKPLPTAEQPPLMTAEETQRLRKAKALFDAIVKHKPPAEALRNASQAWWNQLAHRIGVNSPSPITQALVIQMIEAAEAAGKASDVKIRRRTK